MLLCDVNCWKIEFWGGQNCMNYGENRDLCMTTELFLYYFYYVYNVFLNYLKFFFSQIKTYSIQNLKHVLKFVV